jgi:very-short-patch-repair endonuclease
MQEMESAQFTPLQNLFYYIRDLYNTSDPCYDFEKENSNLKTENVSYWRVDKFILLAKQCEQRSINEFSFAVGPKINAVDFILKVKRILIQVEPKIPFELVDWVVINRNLDIPTVSFKKEIEKIEKFDESEQRVSDLEKYKQQSKNAIFSLTPPPSLKDWIDVSSGKFLRKIEKKVTIAFEDNLSRVKTYNTFRDEFSDYQKKNNVPLKINNIYDALHTLHYELKGKDTKRLYISFGLVLGKIGNHLYRNFIFNIPLKLSLKNQEILLETDTFSGKIFSEQFFTELFDVHFKNEHPTIIEKRKREVLLSIDSFNSKQKEFIFDSDFIRTEFYDSGLDILAVFNQKQYAFFNNQELNYDFDEKLISDQIVFSFSPIIQAKSVESKRPISTDANNIINKINELQLNNNLHLIPDFFKKLFSIEISESDTNRHFEIKNHSNERNSYSATYVENGHRFLFPLPYNDEQFEIAKRLNEQDAVTVKGPPGTGKSHTIANLISHFVAQGKSILVVSHNSKALSVLKEKLPKSIQELAVSLVNESKGNENLKASVNAIIRNLAKSYEERKVTELELQLTNLESTYSSTLAKVYEAVQANTKSLKIFNPFNNQIEEKTAYDWAIFYFDRGQYETTLVKDPILHTTDTKGLAEKLNSLAEIGTDLKPGDFELINFQFLQDDNFLDINELRKIEIKLTEIKNKISIADYYSISENIITERLKLQITDFKIQYSKFETLHISNTVYKNLNFNLKLLKNLLEQNKHLREQISSAEEKLISFQLDLSTLSNIDPDILHQHINHLIVKFSNNKVINWITKSMLSKDLKQFFDCKVNFIPANEIEQFKIIETEINKRKCIKQLSITFNNYLNLLGVPRQNNIQEILKGLDFIIEFSEKLETINHELKEKKLPQIFINSPELKETLLFLENINYYLDFKKIDNLLKETSQKLISNGKSHNLIFQIASAIENIDRASYELYLEEYRRKRRKQIQSLEFHRLFKEISVVLPVTANTIKNLSISGTPFEYSNEIFVTDIFYLKINSFLTLVTNQTKGSDKLLSDLQSIKESIQKQTVDIISYKTWYHKSKNVNYTQKSALNAWLNDLINIGKGYGKNTARNFASAIANMQVAKGAVPIWIMQQDTAVTFFPDATPEQFDLLIIDEASQCDISSLNLIFRCKKCLIVGDENQTSVVADRSIFTIERTNEMLDKYLISHKFKNQFDVNNKNNSIYAISGVIYPNIVALTEHFRCLPEIIGYSNRYVYNSDIVPLKTATEKLFGEPVVVHYVEDNYLDEQKPLIIQQLVQQIEFFIVEYIEGRLKKLPTIGILTLDSSNIKHQTLLIRQISQNELIKQYEDKLELLIGTSREFQGDERDIMFMTITASHSFSEKNNFDIRPPRSAGTEEYMRIFNVAASRAKEKSILFHSIHPDAVGIMNPDCYRKKLIDYYTNVQNKINNSISVKNLQTLINQTDANSGEFEKSVCRFLYNNGFGNFLFPQFEIGKYRIDFGLIKNNKKLAIECDGFTYHSGIAKIQEDIKRQLILERAGWCFFRIQSTDWFYRNSNVSAELINWIIYNSNES